MTPLDLATPFGLSHSGSLAGIWPRRYILNPSAGQLAWRPIFGSYSGTAHRLWYLRKAAWKALADIPGWQWDSVTLSWFIKRGAIGNPILMVDADGLTFIAVSIPWHTTGTITLTFHGTPNPPGWPKTVGPGASETGVAWYPVRYPASVTLRRVVPAYQGATTLGPVAGPYP